jgi:HEPN domain-containing protein
MDNKINTQKLIDYWIESSDRDFQTMLDLFNTKNYHWALFIGHLVLEKLLKAFYVKEIEEFPPQIHDLRRLAEKTGLLLEEDLRLKMDTITRFNINARYDDYKSAFYNLCTKTFAENG